MSGFVPNNIPVKMTNGIDTKSDPKSLQTKLTVLQNASFQSPGQLIKRDGFQALTTNIIGGGSISAGVGLGAFQNQLTVMDGNSLYSYSQDANGFNNQGPMTICNLSSVNSVTRTIYSQSNPDSAYDPVTGLKCYVYADTGSGGINYSVIDSTTGSSIVFNKQIAPSGGTTQTAKVMLLGTHFIIVYFNSGGSHAGINYASISTATPTAITLNNAVSLTTGNVFDCVISNSNLYITYYDTVSTFLSIKSLTPALSLSAAYHLASPAGTLAYLGTTTDASFNIWVAYAKQASNSNFIAVANGALTTTVLAATSFEAGAQLTNATLLVNGTTAYIYGEHLSSQTQGSSNSIYFYQMTIGGTLTAGILLMGGVGLASKAFFYNSSVYLLTIYAGSFASTIYSAFVGYEPAVLTTIEPTYFLINATPALVGTYQNLVLKIAPSLGGSYYTTGILPEVLKTATGNYSIPYLLEERASIEEGSITFETGVQNANISFVLSQSLSKLQFGNNQNIASGQLWAYDGQNIVEQGFHLFPENAFWENTALTGGAIGIGASTAAINQFEYCVVYEWVDNQGQTHQSAPSIPIVVQNIPGASIRFTGQLFIGQNVINNPSSFAGLIVGQVITDITTPANLPADTFITAIDVPNNVIVLSQNATANGSSDILQTDDDCVNEIILPTLRQTNKQNVSIVVYRTQNNGTIFYRVTSHTLIQAQNGLILNNPAVDRILFFDALSDPQIIGNQQLYTTGGTVENINAPATSALTTFKNRAVYLSPENPTQWGYSQQIVPGVPIEFNSELFVENVDQRVGQLLAAGQLDDKLILFGATSKWYVVGQGPSANGTQNDFSDATKIAGVSGCSNQASVIEIPTGLIYQDSQRGLWLLDRSLQESYIGADVEAYNSFPIVAAQLFEDHNKVMFTLSNGTNLLYEYYVGQWEVDPFANEAVDASIFQNNVVYLQSNGLVLEQTPGVFSDNGNVIPMQLQTGWIDFSGLEGFGRVWELQIMGTYFSPHTLNINIYNDFSSTPSQVVTIPVLSQPNIYAFRIKIKQQKCTSMMINITESQSGTPGQGFSLSSIAFRVGTKKGLNKLPAGASF